MCYHYTGKDGRIATMEIISKLNGKNGDIYGAKPVTIAFLGDSVTHGCYECYFKNDGRVETVFERKNAYSTRVGEILSLLYPAAQVNIINSGVSGDSAAGGVKRFERDVAAFSPDLVVIGFALNDCFGGAEKINEYAANIKTLIEKSKKIGAEVVVLTPNMLNTEVSCHLKDERFREMAADFSTRQSVLDEYVAALKETAKSEGVKICDVHDGWKRLYNGGVQVTELLANKLNHPVRELHYYTAIKLVETFFQD